MQEEHINRLLEAQKNLKLRSKEASDLRLQITKVKTEVNNTKNNNCMIYVLNFMAARGDEETTRSGHGRSESIKDADVEPAAYFGMVESNE